MLSLVSAAFMGGYFLLIKDLEQTRGQLSRERKQKEELQEELSQTQDQLIMVQAELEKTKNELSIVSQKLALAEEDNGKLLQAKKELEDKITLLAQEKQILEARLHSLKELKAAIRQVRLEIRQEQIKKYLARKKQQEEIDALKLARGNRGYLTKEGKSLYQSKLDIEVIPAN